MGTTALSVLRQRIHESLEDFISVAVTTAITTNNSVISTNLKVYDLGGTIFQKQWLFITDYANIGIERQITTYTSSSGTAVVSGAALSSDGANKATIQVHRYSMKSLDVAINDAIRETGASLFKEVDDITLVSNSLLVDGHLESWSSSTAMNWWTTTSTMNVARSNTAGETRGGVYSCKATPSSNNGYIALSSDKYPSLLNIQGKTVTLEGYALPETADDAYLVIYTKDYQGTEQTLTSTTANTADEFTLLKLEDQAINDNLDTVEIRLKVATSGQYVCFDDLRLTGVDVNEYLLPADDLHNMSIQQVFIQAAGDLEDIRPNTWTPVIGFETFDNGVDRYLQLPGNYGSGRRIRLVGTTDLSALSSATDTIELDGGGISPLLAYAKYKLFNQLAANTSSQDTERFKSLAGRFLSEYHRLRLPLGLTKKAITLNLPFY